MSGSGLASGVQPFQTVLGDAGLLGHCLHCLMPAVVSANDSTWTLPESACRLGAVHEVAAVQAAALSEQASFLLLQKTGCIWCAPLRGARLCPSSCSCGRLDFVLQTCLAMTCLAAESAVTPAAASYTGHWMYLFSRSMRM